MTVILWQDGRAMELNPTYNYGDLYTHDLAKTVFFHRVVADQYPALLFRVFPSDAPLNKLLSALGAAKTEPIIWAEAATSHWSTHVLQGGRLVHINASDTADQRKYFVHVAAQSKRDADETMKTISSALPEPTQDSEDIVPIAFWTCTSQGPQAFHRKIETPAWSDIQGNYPAKLRDGLGSLMGSEPPFSGGRMILWHGPPGTGKSYAIRSLTRSWSSWCKPQYVVDPERFFGDSSYMLTVLLANPDEEVVGNWGIDEMEADSEDDSDEEGKSPPWRLLICEDADEFLVADARHQQGQALARLLNLADGLVGQGLNLLVLITTNQELASLHPAVSRQGRCLANMHFGGFGVAETRKWLESRTVQADVKVGLTLAEMYELTRDRRQIDSTDNKAHGLYL